MYKLSCTFKEAPSDPYKVKLVDGRCRLLGACASGKTGASTVATSEILLYTGDDDAGEVICQFSSSVDSGAGSVPSKGTIGILNLPSAGVLFEDGIYAVMTSTTYGVNVFSKEQPPYNGCTPPD
jgi:hypothetical protein